MIILQMLIIPLVVLILLGLVAVSGSAGMNIPDQDSQPDQPAS